MNTRLHYAQRKYNLLREETEGYAKLVAALLRFEGGGLTEDRVGAVVRCRMDIGYSYSLYPIPIPYTAVAWTALKAGYPKIPQAEIGFF